MRVSKRLKLYYKRFMSFLNQDSALSWIANVAIAFILIKFVVYPLLGLIFGTSYPIVAVISGSMEHHGSFDDWWESPAFVNGVPTTQMEYYWNYDITKDDFEEFSFRNGFNTGDIMVLRGATSETIFVGDVIVFQSHGREPIIHRVIEKNINENSVTFKTKGDNNPMSYDFESEIIEENVIGKAIFRIPYLGYIKIWFFKILGFFIPL